MLKHVPSPYSTSDGAYAFRAKIAALMNQAIDASGKTREEIAAEMARLTGDPKCSKHVINAATAPSRPGWELSFIRAIAFDQAIGRPVLLTFFSEVFGARILMGEDFYLAELGQAIMDQEKLGNKIERLKRASRAEDRSVMQNSPSDN